MDVHETMPEGATAADVAGAHAEDLRVQGQYGVHYRSYWVDETDGKIFCLVEAPDAETAARVHRESHGLVADRIFEVVEGS
ncbi:Adenylate cyclase [Pimelobacter simplex]|uniref:Adenylate cyclase n=2 Tax=Nocardioides simplex TaxID=2045 RepID=A0A0A1DUD1_NOCSI|nr:Adenylate cyclase [Pimelobacter simplex]